MNCNKDLIVIKMYYGPIISEGVDDFLFDQVIDPILPGTGLPIPLPVRLGLFAIQLQVEAGQTIAAGDVAGKSQYTGQAAQAERAKSLGMNLIYQPGGIQV
jgi:hypothetical protein